MQFTKGLFLSLNLACAAAGATTYQWPDAPPEVLREELFGIRYFLMHENKGAAETLKFLEEQVAHHPSAPAKAYLARVFLLGPDLDQAWQKDYPRGIKLAEEAVQEGSGVAMDLLSKMKVYGLGTKFDPSAGGMLICAAAAKGQARAIAREGYFMMTGRGGYLDYAQGEALVKRAAALGSTFGLRDAGDEYERGWTGKAPDLARAMEFYFQAALYNDSYGWKKLDDYVQRAVPNAELHRAIARVRFASEGGRVLPVKVRAQVEKLEAFSSDNPRAWLELGVVHLDGFYARRDYPKALDYFRRAAAAGQQEAKFFLALARMRGFGVPRDPAGGLAEMEALADGGDARAATRLGHLCYWGSSDVPGMKKDAAKAFHFTRIGAEAGYPLALVNLAFLYENGIGVRENYAIAAKLYWQLYDSGVPFAKEKAQRNLAFAKIP